MGRVQCGVLRLLALLPVLVAACTEQPPQCITVDTACAPLYPPTWDNVYAHTLATSCGADRSACHSDIGLRGGMSFADKDTSYTELLSARVVPGNAACSLMVVRIDGVGKDYQMPQGDPLSAAERCAIAQWVEMGATK